MGGTSAAAPTSAAAVTPASCAGNTPDGKGANKDRATSLNEAVLRTGCLDAVTSVAERGTLEADVLAQTMLLRSTAGPTPGSGQWPGRARAQRGRDPLRPPQLPHPEAARTIAVEIANATFAARSATTWMLGQLPGRRRAGPMSCLPAVPTLGELRDCRCTRGSGEYGIEEVKQLQSTAWFNRAA
ncbi:hypothetical protein [Amycolatopsis sulphurea]|uniref:hypothetical protein n=1 Tax=Amycolatopsis sulphurea TaxID=76022 RepID=UPI0014747EA5|nr:hypothetical protein [Amycolatopsis sulphurea]